MKECPRNSDDVNFQAAGPYRKDKAGHASTTTTATESGQPQSQEPAPISADARHSETAETKRLKQQCDMDSVLLTESEADEVMTENYGPPGSTRNEPSDTGNPEGAMIANDFAEQPPAATNSREEPHSGAPNPPEESYADDNCYASTNEIELPDDPESSRFSEQESAADCGNSDRAANGPAIGDEEREELISSLRSKIPPMIARNRPTSDDPVANHPPDSAARPNDCDSPVIPKRDDQSITRESPKQGFAEIQQGAGPVPLVLRDSPCRDVAASRSVAHFRRNEVHFPARIGFREGDEIRVKDKSFVLHRRRRDIKSILLYGALGLVLVLLLASQLVRQGGADHHPPLIGVVIEGGSGRVMPDVKITLNELGKTILSNHNGIFIFEMVPEGGYTITGETPFYKTAALSLQHGGGGRTVSAIRMEKGTVAAESSQKKNEEPRQQQAAGAKQYGKIKITTNLDNAKILLDNKSYGAGNRTIDMVLAGKHKLVVESNGYETFTRTVTVKGDETTAVEAILAKIEADEPPEPTASDFVRAGDSSVAAGDPAAAIRYYSLALEKQDDPETSYRRAQAYHKIGKPAEARKDYVRAGNLFSSSGRITSAVAAYNAVLELFPNDLTVLRARGYAYIQKGQYESAVADFQTACNLDGNDYQNRIGLGNAYSMLGDYKEAIKHYKKAERLTKDNADVYALIALASLARGKEKDARKYYQKFSETATPQIEKKYASDPEWQRLRQMASGD